MSNKQVAMVIDLNKCIGCQTCTIACKTMWTNKEGQDGMYWNTVSTAPGGGTPKDWEGMGGGFRDGKAQPGRRPKQSEFGDAWEFNVEDVMFGGDKHATLKPVEGHPDYGTNWDEDIGAGDYPNSYHFYIPRICNHCTKPACMEACPRGAIYKRDEDGIVLINEDHCRGFRFCQEACPYKEIYFNTVTGTSQKCIFCTPRIEEGVATACSRQCPGRVRFLGYLDDEDGPIHKLVYKHKVALPLHPEYETEPNVFYVPPLAPPSFDDDGNEIDESRIPILYLVSLFGPEVIEAIEILKREKEIKRQGGESVLMDVLISRNWLDLFGPFTTQPKDVARMMEERTHA